MNFAFGLLFAAPLRAEPVSAPHAVLELFTSQGCSSCPEADRVLGELAKNKELIVLSYSIDYWDYLGWKDTFAKPAFSARQKEYARQRGDGKVYTPQVVVNGQEHIAGSDRAGIELMLKTHARLQTSFDVDKRSDGWQIILPANTPIQANLWLIPLYKSRDVMIGRGENRNRTVTYVNIVRDMLKLEPVAGKARQYLIAQNHPALEGHEGFALLLQEAKSMDSGAKMPHAVLTSSVPHVPTPFHAPTPIFGAHIIWK